MGPLTRQELEAREAKLLAPYACQSQRTRGRVHSEPEPSFRSIYQRDRDRIIHCTAFRRLEYKTQVFVNHEGDYYRTRLTHTLEMAQIARTIARALRLNEDLAEALALAHDIGHPPFGHAGEDALRELMAQHGGFDHNMHGLRIVDVLEERYPAFPGLNLTWEVREGFLKHVPKAEAQQPTLEAQVVDLADGIAYDHHDIDDGLTSRLITEEMLRQVPLWEEAHQAVVGDGSSMPHQIRKYQIIRRLIDWHITDVIAASEQRLKDFGVGTLEDVHRTKEHVIAFSSQMHERRQPLRSFLFAQLYRHYRVVRMSDKAHRFVRDLFGVYRAKPEQLPPTTQRRIALDGLERAICDYVAGMTDRYALEEHQKLFDPYTRV